MPGLHEGDWPANLSGRLDEIREADRHASITLVEALTAECMPAIRALVRRACLRLRRPDVTDDATQNASFEVFKTLSSCPVRQDIAMYLRGVAYNAVTRCIMAQGGLYPTTAQRRQASIGRALGAFLVEHKRPPSEDELLEAQHALLAYRGDKAHDKAELATIDEVRAYLLRDAPFVEDGHDDPRNRPGDGDGHGSEGDVDDEESDRTDDNLALDSLDTERFIRLTAKACSDLHPQLDGETFAKTVMIDQANGTTNLNRLAREFDVSRSIIRTNVPKVWRMANRVAREELGIRSPWVDPGI